jgi:hypothetical protein
VGDPDKERQDYSRRVAPTRGIGVEKNKSGDHKGRPYEMNGHRTMVTHRRLKSPLQILVCYTLIIRLNNFKRGEFP